MQKNSPQSTSGLSRLELIVALLILAGILVFMTLQFASPRANENIEGAFQEISLRSHEIAALWSAERFDDAVSSYTSSAQNVYGLDFAVFYVDHAQWSQLCYAVPSRKICNRSLDRLGHTATKEEDSAYEPIERLRDMRCVSNDPGHEYLHIDFEIPAN